MRRKGFAILLVLVMILTACTSGSSEHSNSSGSLESSESANKTTQLIEAFLANEVKVHVNSEVIRFNFQDTSGKDYTIEELANKIVDNNAGPKKDQKSILRAVDYSYIDCGVDGNMELALRFTVQLAGDIYYYYFIIKEVEGYLQTLYIDTGWSRSHVHINEYGYIYGDGSGGAAYHGFSKSYIDADGKWHFIYSNSTTMGIATGISGITLSFNGSFHTFRDGASLDGEYTLMQFDLNNTPEDPSDDIFTYGKRIDNSLISDYNAGFKGYYFFDLVGNESMFEETHPLKRFFSNEGLAITSLMETEQKIAQKEETEGLTAEIKDGKEVEWQQLDYSFTPYSASCNNNNFLSRMEFFPLALHNTNNENTRMSIGIKADGQIEGYYLKEQKQEDIKSSTHYRNNFSGKLLITERVNDTTYKLSMSEYKLKDKVGTSTSRTSEATGEKTTVNYIEIPGLSAESTFILYTPKTRISEIDKKAIAAFSDSLRQELSRKKVIEWYLLYELNGENRIWYGN